MLQVMLGMEKQLDEFAKREAHVTQLTHECREAVEKAELDRQRATTAAEFLKQKFNELDAARKKEAVERREYQDVEIARSRDEATVQLKAKDQVIQQLNEKMADLHFQIERTARDKLAIEVRCQHADMLCRCRCEPLTVHGIGSHSYRSIVSN